MVRISRQRITEEGALHQVVVDTNEETPKIELGLGAGMTDKDYLVWNVVGAIRVIRAKPEEKDITLAVYRAHREILQNKGASEEDLKEGDRLLTKYTGVDF